MLLTDDGRDILGRGGGGGGECFLKLAFHSLNFPVCERLPRKTTYCRLLKRLPSPIYTSATSSSKCCWKGGTQIFSSRFAFNLGFLTCLWLYRSYTPHKNTICLRTTPQKNLYSTGEGWHWGWAWMSDLPRTLKTSDISGSIITNFAKKVKVEFKMDDIVVSFSVLKAT